MAETMGFVLLLSAATPATTSCQDDRDVGQYAHEYALRLWRGLPHWRMPLASPGFTNDIDESEGGHSVPHLPVVAFPSRGSCDECVTEREITTM
jgi:hypothetical protein